MASLGDRFRDFSETPNGRITMVAVPVAVLAVILVFVALSFIRSDPSPEPEQIVADKTAPAPADDSSAEGSTDAAGGSAAVEMRETTDTTDTYINEDYEVYETRDPFKETDASATPDSGSILAPDGSTSGASSSSTGAASGGAVSQTLSLDSIEQDGGGALYANVTYGSTQYIVRDGDQVGSSPFQATLITTDDATFLYGDDTLVLGVGQSISK